MSNKAKPSLAEQIIELCDEMLRLGREAGTGSAPCVILCDPSRPSADEEKRAARLIESVLATKPTAVGDHRHTSAPSDSPGRIGMACYERWTALAKVLDERAERLADLVKALDPTRDTATFYSPDPVSVFAAYPEWVGNNRIFEGAIKTEVRKDLLAILDAGHDERTRKMWTKMQWPGFVVDLIVRYEEDPKEKKRVRTFYSFPAFVHAFERRFKTLREWAAERARKERDKKATGPVLGRPWQDVQRELLELVEKGGCFTSYDKLAKRCKCAKNTVRKAVRKSGKLRTWKYATAKKSPRAQSLNAVVMDNTPRTVADPADMLPAEDVDRTLARLLEQAKPEERAKINALDENGRRELARLTLEQGKDRRAEEEAPGGNKILGRKP